MSLSENAKLVLIQAKGQSEETPIGLVFSKDHLRMWFRGEMSKQEQDDAVKELLSEKLIKKYQSYWVVTVKGKSYNTRVSQSTRSIINNFSNISNSNIANMSSGAIQSLDLSKHSIEVQQQFEKLKEAISSNDNDRVKNIIDGLWISAPQLVLSLIQIGLSLSGGAR